jgi:DNA-binding MarR family transcriptional regulator
MFPGHRAQNAPTCGPFPFVPRDMTKPASKTARKTARPARATPAGKGGSAPAGANAAHREASLAVLEQFRVIFRSTKMHFQWVKEKTGVSGAQLWVLAELHQRPGLRVTELAQALAIHQSTASNLIDKLVALDLVRRQRSAEDQRVVHVWLTAGGKAVVDRAPRPLEGVLPDALRSLGASELRELRGQLERLAGRMKVRDRAARRIPLGEM